MTTAPSRLVVLTDGRAKHLLPEDEMHEPEVDSVVLTRGLHGLAWQRHVRDGKWHSTNPRSHSRTWEEMLNERDLILIYDAPERKPEHKRHSFTGRTNFHKPPREQQVQVQTWATGSGN